MVVSAVTAMGFSENAAKRAALATENTGAEAAVKWAMQHMEDADLNDPLPPPGGGGGGGGGGERIDEPARLLQKGEKPKKRVPNGPPVISLWSVLESMFSFVLRWSSPPADILPARRWVWLGVQVSYGVILAPGGDSSISVMLGGAGIQK